MSKLIKAIACVAFAAICGTLFAYNGGYENSIVGSTTIDGKTYAGYGNNTLTAREESGTTIPANKYAQCSKLTSVNLANVTSLGDAAFAYSALTSVELPSTLKSIGYIPFGGCKNLSSVTINSTAFMTAADEAKEPFRDCTALKTVTAKCAPPSWDFKKVFPNVTSVRVPSTNISAWQAKKYSGVTVKASDTGYVIRYYKNDGGADMIEQDYASGATHSLAWQGALGWTRTGYTFLGYATSATAKVPNYYNGQKVKDLAAKGGTKILYGVWCKSADAYYVTFNKNDGSGASATYNFEAGVTRSLIWQGQLGWERTGYTFLGYATSATAKVPNYYNGQKVKDLAAKGKSLVLYGVWCKSADAYYVTFNKNDGSGASATYSFEAGVSRSMIWQGQLGWERTGYTFLGYATSATAKVPNYYNGQKVKDLVAKGKSLVLYGVWCKSADAYYVTFNKDDGSGTSATYSFEVGVTRSLIWQGQLGWTRTGYTLLGWATWSKASVAKYDNGEKVTNLTTAGKTITLYAVWKKTSAAVTVVAPEESVDDRTVGVASPAGTPSKDDFVFGPGYIRGVFADGSGTFDMLLAEDGTAFFVAQTGAGDWSGECEVVVLGDMLVLTFDDDTQLVLRKEGGLVVGVPE